MATAFLPLPTIPEAKSTNYSCTFTAFQLCFLLLILDCSLEVKFVLDMHLNGQLALQSHLLIFCQPANVPTSNHRDTIINGKFLYEFLH